MPDDVTKNKACPKEHEGFTQIPNRILDHLCKAYIPARERQCLDLIIRQTYGYHKHQDKISLSQFVENTELKTRTVRDCLSSLEEKKIINISPGTFRSPKGYSLNQDFTLWSVQRNPHSAEEPAQSVQRNPQRSVQKNPHHKRKKESLKKGTEKTKGEFKKNMLIPADYSLSDYHQTFAMEKGFVMETVEAMFEKFKAHHEAKGSKFKSWNAAWRTWVLNQIQYHGAPAPLKTHQTTNAEILA
ncbi:MAG: replication protein [Proteobacteria bacterium]|nr:replication protein [Desulfobacula sp.]MBU3951013.1 replication protein [Pseudomonadota bacterium]MBU4131581.1 replication protein [Pseudomonadota bacterium]